MRLIESHLVGEDAFEAAVLRDFIFHLLDRLLPPRSAWVGMPDEAGVMTVGAEWGGESLEWRAWIEAESDYADPSPEDFESGEFRLAFRWGTAAREGDWCELEGLFLGDAEESLEVAGRPAGLRLFTA